MRIRAGVVLVDNGKVALIERFREGNHYFVFPGGGTHDGETPEQAAVREMEEETGLRVKIKKKLIEIHFDLSIQFYFLVERVSGEYGTGTGEEFNPANPKNIIKGTYKPIWMNVEDLAGRDNVYPLDTRELVLRSVDSGWPDEPVIVSEPMS